MIARESPGLLVDAHVHFHECFTWPSFLDAAAANFTLARRSLGLSSDSPGCLMFTESAGANHCRSLTNDPTLLLAAGWDVEMGDRHSLLLRHARHGRLVIIAGRQIVTAERLEVLALGCPQELPDGRPIRNVIRAVSDHGAIGVVPWGYGKWLGQRGRIVRSLIEDPADLPVYLGDNGGRSNLLPRPSTFDWAEGQGAVVLGGSDPLPLASHARRAGSYGFVLDEWPDTAEPTFTITTRLRGLRHSPAVFGNLSSFSAALRSQIEFRLKRRRTTPSGQTAVA